jgi:hypothetical protein
MTSPPPTRLVFRRLAMVVGFAWATVSVTARAEPPAPELMTRLAAYAAHFEAIRVHASYSLDGRLETLDGDGKADSWKEMKAQVETDGPRTKLTVVRYTEDGKDKTEEARKKARESAEEKKKDKGKPEVRIPLLAAEQPRYVFDEVEVDRADPSRVRIAFVPKVREDDTIEGSAWVDTRTATLLSAGFKLSRTPMFVDYVHITVEFGAPTPLGPAISKLAFDGQGGILFFRKHFRGRATFSDYRIPQ